MGTLNRRDFLKALGLGGTVTVASACGIDDNRYYTPVEQILPYVVRPEQVTPGTPTFFATTITTGPEAFSVTARHRDGRVVHLGANKRAPGRPAIPRAALIALQRHYAPDRLQAPAEGGTPTTWKAGLDKLASAVKSAKGKVVYLGPYRSGTIVDVITKATDQAIFWEPLGRGAEAIAARKLFGADAGLPQIRLADAHYVLSFGADFLGHWGGTALTGDYAKARNPNHDHFVARFALVSAHRGQTGANADDWHACVPGSEASVALAVAKLVADKTGYKGPARKLISKGNVAEAASASGLSSEVIEGIAAAFVAGPAVALPGGVAGASTQAVELAAATMLLNIVAGHKLMRDGGYKAPVHAWRQIKKLIEQMNAGKVSVLLLDDVNPVFTLPSDSGFAEALSKVGLVTSLSSHSNETHAAASLTLPTSNTFEDWGDEEPHEGTFLLRQPSMTPLNNTRSLGDVMLRLWRETDANAPKGNWHQHLKQTWRSKLFPMQAFWDAYGKQPSARDVRLWIKAAESEASDETLSSESTPSESPKGAKGKKGGKAKGAKGKKGGKAKGAKGKKGGKAKNEVNGVKFQRWWEQRLGAGFFRTPYALRAKVPQVTGTIALSGEAAALGQGLPVVTYPHPFLHDGRYANEPWAQEVPEPMSGNVWDTWVTVHPETAASKGWSDNDLLELSAEGRSIRVGVEVNPFIKPGVLAVPFGNGHTQLGRYADGIGVRVSDLLSVASSKGAMAWQQVAVKATKVGTAELVGTIGGDTDAGRDLAVLVPADLAAKKGDYSGHAGEITGIHHLEMDERLERGKKDFYPMPDHPTYRFGMTIDTNACNGCGACSIACYAENNLPVVGKSKVAEGREMNWVRINRFIEGDEVVFAPMMCQQCGHAGCESVCPVLATYHTIDGLNAMIYNRCVGTRYCSNACPFSVRKFNYHSYGWPEPFNLQLNPDVATRTMGVMEKCTFCVQRQRRLKSAYRDEGFTHTVPEKALFKLTACAEACPSHAITFGNLVSKDADGNNNSELTKLRGSPRSYEALADLNVMSAINYLGKASFHTTLAHHGGAESGEEGGH